MDVKRKVSDFITLEDGRGNLPKLAGLGAAAASSILVSAMATGVAVAADVHCDKTYFWGLIHSDASAPSGYSCRA